MFVKLKQLQDTASIMAITHGHEPFVEDEGEFDKTEESASASASSQHSQQTKQGRDETGIKRKPLTLPSNGNVGGKAIEVEIHHQTKQAWHQLHQLRDIMADISFQYLHVIRTAICKSVRLTGQKQIKSLHNDLVLHA